MGDALSRHAWLGRVLDVARRDVDVSWWLGSRSFRGVEPPARLQGWSRLRRVRVVEKWRPLLELDPLAVDRERLHGAVAELLARTPLTDLATCTRAAPRFAWSAPTLALVATHGGRTLVLRALRRLVGPDVNAALGRATGGLIAHEAAEFAAPAVALLPEARAVLEGEAD